MSAANYAAACAGKRRDTQMDCASFSFALVSSQNRLSSRLDPLSPAPRVGEERALAPQRGALSVSRTPGALCISAGLRLECAVRAWCMKGKRLRRKPRKNQKAQPLLQASAVRCW
jgi:hypothetical protein